LFPKRDAYGGHTNVKPVLDKVYRKTIALMSSYMNLPTKSRHGVHSRYTNHQIYAGKSRARSPPGATTRVNARDMLRRPATTDLLQSLAARGLPGL
ncbi:hypothetical protein BaRGS_00007090, partial [Batillaria attramentaria]